MCSQMMENYQGDLADIVRATASTVDGGSSAAEVAAAAVIPDWQLPSNTNHYPSNPAQDFGDPFAYMMRDPLMQNIDNPASGFFYNSSIINGGVEENGCINHSREVLDDHEMKRRPNIFSRMLQISPNAKLPVSTSDSLAAAAAAAAQPQRGLKGPPILVPNSRTLVESPGLQISSPRITGIKRRKSQAKKVVCIPAPAPANIRASGEVVPSDLWAWRKYGQKPIKGSPYPRGYYRCSSSKGCSARKQVERSRTDPNMLVITYTSEHNHPWPTQRNALAGSTRSQPSKSSHAAKNSAPNSQTQKATKAKQEQKEIGAENTVISPTADDDNSAAVKEETDQDFDNQLEMEEADQFGEGFPQTYKPILVDSNYSEDSFFANLGEIEADPLNLFFTQGFSGNNPAPKNNDLDPFSIYDWATNNSSIPASTTTSSSAAWCGESKRDS